VSSSTSTSDLRQRADHLRALSIRSTTKAGSGHPTSCMSAADIAAAVFFDSMRYDPADPRKLTNDRFVLSKGHAAPLLYAAMAEYGVVTEQEVMQLREFSSDLEGHPTPRLSFVDMATGSLGQGLSGGAGLALAAKLDGLDSRTYVLLGDSEMAEGSVWEALAFASFYKLGNLIAICDCNRLGQTGPTMYEHDTEVYARRVESFGWDVQTVDGHDLEAVRKTLQAAQSDSERPSFIVAKTLKGQGVAKIADENGWHGKAIPEDMLDEALAEIGAPDSLPPFVPEMPPEPPAAPAALDVSSLRPDEHADGAATRKGYGVAIAKLAKHDRRVIALDAETSNSTYAQTVLKDTPDQFVECYIAEQNMVGVACGLAAKNKIPFCSTFGAFYSRAFDQIRMAGVSQSNIKLVGSHAGISIGQDGPSQMALEDLAAFRTIPGGAVLYPSDAVSCEQLVFNAAVTPGIVYIRTGRPNVPTIYKPGEDFPVGKFKVVRESDNDRALVVGAGVTLFEALKAHDQLQEQGVSVRVIDLYSLKPIDAEELVRHAHACGDAVVTVEDHYPEGGLGDAVLGALAQTEAKVTKLAVNELPRSGEPEELLEKFGISAGHIAKAVLAAIKA